MQASEQQYRLSPEEYLTAERASILKREYLDGEILALANTSREHNQIAANMVRVLSNQLINRPCRVFASTMKVKIRAFRTYTYPDLVAVYGQEEYEDGNKDVLLNPVLIAEILSDATEAYDRVDKFSHYQRIASFKEYVLISQYNCKVERFSRQLDGIWVYTAYQHPEDRLVLSSIQCEVPLNEVYSKMQFRKHRLYRFLA
ncbi:Uma2 family endonuclease [Candidatus Electronema sp. PJ]|uniref:Uma2 family endonuclease n=1 Tax=Candidatus Electronema sp. PJ TaxID=3401572 RepID=UPI003AA96D1E